MICDDISALLGFHCLPMNGDGTVVKIEVPFRFDDGDAMPVFAESFAGGQQVRFFDDCGVLMHFSGRGMDFDDGRRAKFVRAAASNHGVCFSDGGELEAWASINEAASAFARYMSALLQIVSWERDQRGVSTDTALFVEEVAMYLKVWKPNASLTPDPEFDGISGQRHKLDFLFDGKGVVATGCHQIAAAAALWKMLDIRGAGSQPPFLVVIDDRPSSADAEREGLVMQTVAEVLPFTNLEANAKRAGGTA